MYEVEGVTNSIIIILLYVGKEPHVTGCSTCQNKLTEEHKFRPKLFLLQFSSEDLRADSEKKV